MERGIGVPEYNADVDIVVSGEKMPPISAKGNGKKKVLKGTETAPQDLVKNLLLAYEARCKATRQQICVPMRMQMKKCIDDERLVAKLVMEHKLRNPPKRKRVSNKRRQAGARPRKKDAFVLKRLPPDNDKLPVTIEPLLEAVRAQRYLHIKDLYIWGVLIPHPHVVSLCDLLEKGSYPIRTLALQDCMLPAHSMMRLGRAVARCRTVQTLDLDYNEFGDEGCKNLCNSLAENTHLLSVSMCYCALTADSGVALSRLVCTTVVKDLFLNGNDLDTRGVSDLVRPLLDFAVNRAEQKSLLAAQKAEMERQAAADPSGGDRAASASASASADKKPKGKKKKKRRRKGSRRKASPPVPGPWICKLHLADNGIHYKKNPVDDRGLIDTVACMNLLAKFIAFADELRELDLDDNWVSDSGSRDLLEGLNARKETKLPKVSVKLNYRMEPALLASILKLGSGGTLKKKRGRRKKKK